MTTKFEETAPLFMGRLIDDFDLSHEDAAAIVGNAAHECGAFEIMQEINPTVKGSKGGYGWMQWTGPRRREFEAWLKRKGWTVDEFEANYSFLFRELIGSEGRVLPMLKATQGLEAKVELFMKVFLRPGIPHLDSRIYYARRCMKMQPVRAETSDAPALAPAEPKTGVEKVDDMLSRIVKSFARHALTGIGTVLVAKGLIAPGSEDAFVEMASGVVAGIAGLGWSYLNSLAAEQRAKK